MLMSIGGLVPVPSDALVTPVTFSVRKRGLRGILEDFDAAEDGTRELCAEWVVGKKTWHRLQAEWKARKEGKFGEKPKRKERVVLYLHGGTSYHDRTPCVPMLTAFRRSILYVQCGHA